MPVPEYTPEYAPESPYWLTPIANNYMTYYVHRSIDPHNDDEIIEIDLKKYEHRPDLLSYDFYGTPHLWWVFGVRNGWEDPVYDMKMGVEVIVPPASYIRSIL